jgi:hypothetical protein
MKKMITKIQKNLVALYRSFDKKSPLFVLSKDNCSETSRIVGCWFLKEKKNLEVYILKGDSVKFGTKQAHDVLVVCYKNKIFLLDPAVWQFFKNKKSIFWGEFYKMSDAFDFLKLKYGGKWKVSEKLKKEGIKEITKLSKVIEENIKN